MPYEYLIVTTAAAADVREKDRAQTALSTAGGQGWRYAGNFPSHNGTWIVMERELQAAGRQAG
jgi:hypothetical protein